MSTVTKNTIVNVIYTRFGKSLKKRIINDALVEICDFLQNELLQDHAVSVENFGTFSPFVFPGHRGMNVASGDIRLVAPFRTVRFHAHATLLGLLACKRSSFLGRRQK